MAKRRLEFQTVGYAVEDLDTGEYVSPIFDSFKEVLDWAVENKHLWDEEIVE